MAKAPPGTSVVKYGGFDLDEADEAEKELKASGTGNAFLKLEVGKTRIRFIPPLPGKKWRRATAVHYVDVPGAGRVSFVCPRIEAKQPCIVCKKSQQLLATGNEVDEKKGKKIAAQRRCFASVIDRGDPEAGPRILAFSRTIEEQLIEIRKDTEDGGDFVDPINGVDIVILRTGTGQFDTRYKVQAGKQVPISTDAKQMNEWISTQPNLDKYARVQSAEDIAALLRGEKPEPRGGGQKPDPDEDEDDVPAAKAKPKGKRVADSMGEVDDD